MRYDVDVYQYRVGAYLQLHACVHVCMSGSLELLLE